jgi:hypothetical protein
MNRNTPFFKKFFSGCLLLLMASNTSADLQTHGFISQSIIISEDNPFYDDEPGTHLNFREIGFNGSWQANDRLRFTGQFLSRRAGDIDDGKPEFDLVSVDYKFLSRDTINAGVRLGRLKNQFGLYNVTRDIPHARLGVVVPQSVYFESFRDAVLRADGAEFYTSGLSPLGDWSLHFNYGDTEIEESLVEAQFFQREILGDFNDFEGRLNLFLQLEPSALPGLTLAYTRLQGDVSLQDFPTLTPTQQFQAGVAIALDPFEAFNYVSSLDLEVDLSVYSAEYRAPKWALSLEYLNIDTVTSNVTILGQPGLPDSEDQSEAYYVQLEWNPVERWSFYTRMERLYYDKDDRDGSNSAVGLGINADGRFAKIFTLGARWYITEDFSIGAQFSKNKGFAHSVGSTDVDYDSLKENWDLGILQFSYHF